MTNQHTDDEIARLTALRDVVRQSIADMEDEGASGASFENRAINYLPLMELKNSEAEYTIRINNYLFEKQGLNYMLGNLVQIKQDLVAVKSP